MVPELFHYGRLTVVFVIGYIRTSKINTLNTLDRVASNETILLSMLSALVKWDLKHPAELDWMDKFSIQLHKHVVKISLQLFLFGDQMSSLIHITCMHDFVLTLWAEFWCQTLHVRNEFLAPVLSISGMWKMWPYWSHLLAFNNAVCLMLTQIVNFLLL